MTTDRLKMMFCIVITSAMFGPLTVYAADLQRPPAANLPLDNITIPSRPVSSVVLNAANNFQSTFEGVIIEATFSKVNFVPNRKDIGLEPPAYIHLYVSPLSPNPLPAGKYNVFVSLYNTAAGTFSFYYPNVIWSAFAAPDKLISSCATQAVDAKSTSGCGVFIPLNTKKQIDIDIKHSGAPWITGITIQRYL
jgi:hypothetical protein